MQRSKFVAFTGGPCAGKSTVLNAARQRAEDCGLDAYVAAEAATLLIEAGMKLKLAVNTKDWGKVRQYQKQIIEFQYRYEEQLSALSEVEGRNAVVLCDRGIPDNRAYLPEGKAGDDVYENLVRCVGLTTHRAL